MSALGLYWTKHSDRLQLLVTMTSDSTLVLFREGRLNLPTPILLLNQVPRRSNTRNCASEEADGTSKADLIIRPEFRLIDLRTDNSLHLCSSLVLMSVLALKSLWPQCMATHVRNTDSQRSRGRSMCCADTLRPDDGVDADRARERKSYEDVLHDRNLDGDEDDVADAGERFHWLI